MSGNRDIQCILFCEFHPVAGPKIVHQVRANSWNLSKSVTRGCLLRSCILQRNKPAQYGPLVILHVMVVTAKFMATSNHEEQFKDS